MNSHIDIKINGHSLVLPDDFSLSAEEQNPVFGDVSFFSYPIKVSTEQNLSVLKNIAHRDAAIRGMDFEHARASVIADGMPMSTGQVITQEDVEIGKDFEFNIDSEQESFSELIGNLECRDVKVKDHLVIGEKIGKIYYKYRIDGAETYHYWNGENDFVGIGPLPKGFLTPFVVQPSEENRFSYSGIGDTESLQALGFSCPARCKGFPSAEKASNGDPIYTESFINVQLPYPFPYCNSRVAYTHPGVKTNSDGTQETDGTVKGNDQISDNDFGQYWCLDAFRQQSGMCFYVLYFLDCLFEQLGVSFDKSDLLEIEDFTRLAFFTTQCHYDEELKHYNVSFNNDGASYSSLSDALAAIPEEDRVAGLDVAYKTTQGKYVRYTPTTAEWSSDAADWQGPLTAEVLSDDEIDEWLQSRKTGGAVKLGVYVGKPKGHYQSGSGKRTVGEEFTELPDNYVMSNGTFNHYDLYQAYPILATANPPKGREDWYSFMEWFRSVSGEVHLETEIYDMVANSDNFPKVAVSTLIKSLENSFGIRFLYNPEKRTVRARLLRNVYRNAVTRKFNGTVISMTPVNEKITGIRMAYSAESDAKTQRDNVRYGIRDYDTDYNYIDYPEDRTVTNLDYTTIIKKVASTNRNVYIDQLTGNRYRIKVDAEAEDVLSLKPVLFQVGQWKGIEIGDCSERDSNYVREFTSDITPLSLNVINAKAYNADTSGQTEPILAPFLDVEMEHEYLKQTINGVFREINDDRTTKVRDTNYKGDGNRVTFPEAIQLLCVQELKLAESYDPTKTEYGNSPLQDIDWGLTMAVMRGPGSGTSGYISIDSSESVSVSWEEFKAIMEENFQTYGTIQESDDAFSSHVSIGTFYDAVNAHSDSDMLDEKKGLTFGVLKRALETALTTMCTGRDTTTGWVKNILYYIITGQPGVLLCKVNLRVLVNIATLFNAIDGLVNDPSSDTWNLRQLLDRFAADIAEGKYSRETMLLESFNLTVGNIIDEIQACYDFGHYDNINWKKRYRFFVGFTKRGGYLSPDDVTSGSVGTGTGSQIINFDRGYDGFDNSRWRQTVGVYAMTSDSLTPKGETFDYNSQDNGDGGGERISLMIRSWVQPEWADQPLCIDDERDVDGSILLRIRSRGLADAYMAEHFHALLHRKKFNIDALVTLAQLLDIRNHWEDRYDFDGKVGFIDKIRYSISRATGVGKVTIDFFAI